MLTHCPECKGELSTAANNCPHCGAPVNHGQLAARGGPPQQLGAPPPKQSHFLRNCLACGCLLFVLLVAAVVGIPAYMFSQIKNSMVDKAGAPALAAAVAPGVQPPTGYELKGGANFAMFGIKAKGVFMAPVGVELGNGQPPKTLLAFGAFSGKNQTKEQIHEQVEKFLTQMAQGGQGGGQGGRTKVVSQGEEDLPIGPGGASTVKALHIVGEDDRGQRTTQYLVLLDDYENEFGYLIVAGLGTEKDFDVDALKGLLKTVKPPRSATPATPTPVETTAPPAPGDGK